MAKEQAHGDDPFGGVPRKEPLIKQQDGLLLSPEEINNCYDIAIERWEEDGKTGVWEFSHLWQYIANEIAKAQLAKIRNSPDREKELLNFTSLLSLKLGVYIGQGLFKSYPDNFNQMMPELAKELFDPIIASLPKPVSSPELRHKIEVISGKKPGFASYLSNNQIDEIIALLPKTVSSPELKERIEEALGIMHYGMDAWERYKTGVSLPDDWNSFSVNVEKIIAIIDGEEKEEK